MVQTRSTKLEGKVDVADDHVLGNPEAELTLVEYGSYACSYCHAAHDVIAGLRDRFGDQMRYVFRHRPVEGNEEALRAAELAEYAYETTGQFWPVHDALMKRGPNLTAVDLEEIAAEFNLPPRDAVEESAARRTAERRVREDISSAKRSGVLITPTFFINNRRYEGPWDETTLAEAMFGTLGHRIHTATLNFVRWGPSAGFLLLLMSVLAVVLMNSPVGPSFDAFWKTLSGFEFGKKAFTVPLLDWVNHGLLSIFFLVVGLEIKREFTIGRLSTLRAGALPVIAAFGGICVPILIYLLIAPKGPQSMGWGIPIATDTAFAVALIVLLRDRVAVELRVFLTAAVIIDDLVAIGIIAVFYSDAIIPHFLIASAVITALLIALNRWGIYRSMPYAILGLILWVCLHEAGLHATLAGVILALVTPTRPPANLRALMAQGEAIMQAEIRSAEESVMRHGPSEPTMRALETIQNRMESPAAKLLRTAEPWSSYIVLPVFALANAGVVLALGPFETHGRLMLAITLGLIIGKPVGIVLASWLAVRFGIAEKPTEYSWRQLCGAGVLAGIGFTMSLFIAGEAFPDPADFAAAKIAIFAASLLAGVLGAAILWKREPTEEGDAAAA